MSKHTFTRPHKIHFSECDPAGIVFYPQYFILFNDLTESWIDSLLPEGYQGLILGRRIGMPTVRQDASVTAISRFGDDVDLELDVDHVGNRSMSLELRCVGHDGVLRMAAKQTIVTTSLDTHQAVPIPEDLKAAIERR